ncbi:MAG: DUF4412 domain-containing protein [Gammaproteobacteria bacterium]|nr:DUF4412 domain-containing protein [Gammaproteobacteria bacterium]
MSVIFRLLLLSFLLILSNQARTASMAVEFSAEAVMKSPQHADSVSRMYVSKNAVRTEITAENQNFIEIIFPDEGRAIMLNPQLKAYREVSVDKNLKNKTSTNNSPCEQIPDAQCEKLGQENINGRSTEKWQVITTNQGKKQRTLHWIDTERKLALREFFPDGSVSELSMLGKEIMNGRKTEKWQRLLSRPDGSKMVSYQWYDPELEIAIREELPGGYVRELRNIKIARQKSSLFKIPDEFKKVENAPAAYSPTR